MGEKFPVSGEAIPEIDLRKISVIEWRTLWLPGNDAEGDAILSRVSSIPLEEIQKLNFYDYRALCDAVREKARKPLEDPKNSASASI